MANDTLNTINGFFYQYGSKDYPANYDPNKPFGFDSTSSQKPIFKYSVNDVERSIDRCRSLTRVATYHTKNTNILLGIDDINNSLSKEDITSDSWGNAYRIIEALYDNPTAVDGNPSSSDYLNKADEMLASKDLPDNKYYVETYTKGSLAFERSIYIGRLSVITFTCDFKGRGKVSFRVYYDADYFVERGSNLHYKVYRYEDMNNDEEISPEEFDKKIVQVLFDILKEGKYEKYVPYSVPKRLSDSETVQEQFFIFSSIDREITDEIAKGEIIKYLDSKYPDQTYKRYTYPTLYSQNEITIVPMWENTIDKVGGESKVVHPLSLLSLANKLVEFGYSISPGGNYRPTEIFHVGPGAGWSQGGTFRFNFPLLAIERRTDSSIIQPISYRFPDYKPIYGEVDTNEASEFHFILVTILAYLNKDTVLTDEFKREYSIKEEYDDKLGRYDVMFTFAGELWVVYGKVKPKE